jgi:Ribbon-helix-helix protein, copG family
VKRTTIYLEPELEVLLKLETQRRGKSMAELIREALRSYLRQEPVKAPPGAGAFASGRKETATKAEGLLRKLRFGRES